jgi:MFS family permease
MAIVAPLAGTISDKIGIRRLTSLGMALLAIGLFLLARLGPQSSTGEIIFAMGICGLGTGIFISPNTSGLMGSAPRNRQGIAAGILATSRNVGMVLGVGMAGAIFTTILAQTSPVAGQNLYQALHISFLCSAVIALIGLFVSLANKESNQAASDPVTSIL